MSYNIAKLSDINPALGQQDRQHVGLLKYLFLLFVIRWNQTV